MSDFSPASPLPMTQMSPLVDDSSPIAPLLAIIHRTANLLQNTENSHAFTGIIVLDDVTFQAAFKVFASDWKIVSLAEFTGLEFRHYYDLAVMVFANSADNQSADNQSKVTATIQRCRDLFAQHSLIFAPVGQDFIAFGFNKLGEETLLLAEKPYQGWQFNLFDYKQLPDWFNSRFWANPENWNKFRW